jgi:hypothetical protein
MVFTENVKKKRCLFSSRADASEQFKQFINASGQYMCDTKQHFVKPALLTCNNGDIEKTGYYCLRLQQKDTQHQQVLYEQSFGLCVPQRYG